MKPNEIWWDSWDCKDQILWNPWEFDGIHEIVSNYQILWIPLDSDGIHEVFRT